MVTDKKLSLSCRNPQYPGASHRTKMNGVGLELHDGSVRLALHGVALLDIDDCKAVKAFMVSAIKSIEKQEIKENKI